MAIGILLTIVFIASLFAINGVRALFGAPIPEFFKPRSHEITGDTLETGTEREARAHLIIMGGVALLVMMAFTSFAIGSIARGDIHPALMRSWHGLALRNVLGVAGLVLGVGVVRAGFLKHLPAAQIKGATEPAIRARLIVTGLLLAEIGALLYYSVK